MQVLKTYILILLCFCSLLISAQEKVTYSGDPDSSFFTARELAFAGNRVAARDTLTTILSVYPEYTDVRVLLAKTHTWDKEYDSARKHFNIIISKEKEIKEVWVAAINNELYSENYATALGLANKALKYIPNDEDVAKQKQYAINGITGVTEEGQESKIDTTTTTLKNQFGLTNSFEIFDVVYDPMFYSSIEYKRETLSGPIIPRINYSNRFGTHGLQYELDFYPKLSKKIYGYLNYGFSNAPTFPKHRAGVEVYANYPKNMELSLGVRYLDFKSIKATIATASVGLYSGNYFFSARPYVTAISNNNNLGFSGTVLARKYLRDKDNYLGIIAGVGYASELKQLRNAQDALLAETVLYVESQQVLFEYQFTGKKNPNIYKTNLGVTRQELIFEPGKFFWSVSAGITYQVKF
ncbi:YaiO family outer membrane beta-barrel protein [uncultured Maribacter sp.]|uniref:YaiO family outer membrane beta-barrel protein n=1 Tax=uncultured Maribacter sp. TaxID=431308 RepID=UPI0026357A38|nr:YaiO family outer membrane beta-barrel protein [uncultured Maribacter sp.]